MWLAKSHDAVKYLDQQYDVALRHQARQDGARRRRRVSVSLRYPRMEGIEAALDRHADRDQRQQDEQRGRIRVTYHHALDGIMRRNHQQLSGDVVQDADAYQKKSRSYQAHDHVAYRRHYAVTVLPDHDHTCKYGSRH